MQRDGLARIVKRITRRKPLLVILSGLSGAGKDAAIEQIKRRKKNLCHIVTTTTRRKRPDEIDGVHYHFISKEEFKTRISKNEFLEWANVYSNYYGVPAQNVKKALKQNDFVVIKVDVQGAKTLKKIVPEAIYIFIIPPSTEDLMQRLLNRGDTLNEDIDLRLNKARDEIKYLTLFDYIIENKSNQLQYTVSKILSILDAEKCKVKPRKIRIPT